ncbi:Ribonuclease I precursor [Tritonibacter multivorans]|uniref:Ribonuclease I n=1 Tax=Tritonibacter multivorans TaxID=928856 RepID=A0A0P1GBV4_9RHOB|nr:ribonuclease T2 [Tritonibacter multivorans]MDA7421392.1 ribonuclease T2 [Tritonibacter multivorans]CUH78868.1 Ribonuclease I precursor [Tritonibacter multivorans]SFD28332.1 ribonuclease T2 [Tritonibacter multivorans]
MRGLFFTFLGLFALIGATLAPSARADGERAGEFDYYVLALSWSPNWCEIEGDAKGSDQCDARHDHGWTLHGLWPQFHQGWPSYCRTPHGPPTRRMSNEMADIMGTAGLAWHQWKKHGTCTGLTGGQYYALMREAYTRVNRPAIFRKIPREVRLPASLVEEAFLKENPTWSKDSLTITCRDGFIQEARVCLSRDLEPVPCGRDVIKDCRMKDARFTPVR